MNTNNARRAAWGALLGGTLGSALGAGLNGFWDWVYLFYVPVQHGTETLVGLACGGLAGIAWGFLVAFPRRWWAGAFLSVVILAAVLSLPFGIGLLIIFLPAAFAAWVLAGVLRGLLNIFLLARLRWNCAKSAWLASILLLVFLAGLAITWPLDQASEAMTGRRAVLQKVHRYGQGQEWEDYVLRLNSMDSGYATVTVYMTSGERYTCRVTQWQETAPGSPAFYDLLGVYCEPGM